MLLSRKNVSLTKGSHRYSTLLLNYNEIDKVLLLFKSQLLYAISVMNKKLDYCRDTITYKLS